MEHGDSCKSAQVQVLNLRNLSKGHLPGRMRRDASLS